MQPVFLRDVLLKCKSVWLLLHHVSFLNVRPARLHHSQPELLHHLIYFYNFPIYHIKTSTTYKIILVDIPFRGEGSEDLSALLWKIH